MRLARQRTWQHVAADDDLIDAGLTDLRKNRVQCRKISVDVVHTRCAWRPPTTCIRAVKSRRVGYLPTISVGALLFSWQTNSISSASNFPSIISRW